jgi:hypothetical protein
MWDPNGVEQFPDYGKKLGERVSAVKNSRNLSLILYTLYFKLYGYSIHKVYSSECLRHNTNFNKDLVSVLNLLMQLRYMFT